MNIGTYQAPLVLNGRSYSIQDVLQLEMDLVGLRLRLAEAEYELQQRAAQIARLEARTEAALGALHRFPHTRVELVRVPAGSCTLGLCTACNAQHVRERLLADLPS